MGQLEQQLLNQLKPTLGRLCACREEALERFERLGLPAFCSENYQRTDLSTMLEGNWRIQAPVYQSNLEHIQLPVGAFSGMLSDFNGELPSIPSTNDDALQALTMGVDAQAFLIYLPKDCRLSTPIEVTALLESQDAILAPSRFVLILEDGAQAEIVSRDRNISQTNSLGLQSVEIYLSKGAKLNYTDIEDSVELARRISTCHLYQEEGSDANISFISLRSGKTRNNYYCNLAGERASLSLSGIVINSGGGHVDNYSYISHSVPHCTSNELFKYVLSDHSYGIFTGRILVAKDAQKTEAYQNNRNLLLSPDARMQAKPQLEIYADDVRCSHGMTTGQLSQDALFYMRQRGIEKSEAKRLLSIAFAEDVLALIEREELRDALREEVAVRFAQ